MTRICHACSYVVNLATGSCTRCGRLQPGIGVVSDPITADEYPSVGRVRKLAAGDLPDFAHKGTLTADAQARKNAPMARGLLDYFPRALAAVAELSRVANEQHNPGEPLHWSKEKSSDHADCLIRHLVDRGKIDTDEQRHSTKVAWRALANLEIELEAAEAPAP